MAWYFKALMSMEYHAIYIDALNHTHLEYINQWLLDKNNHYKTKFYNPKIIFINKSKNFKLDFIPCEQLQQLFKVQKVKINWNKLANQKLLTGE